MAMVMVMMMEMEMVVMEISGEIYAVFFLLRVFMNAFNDDEESVTSSNFDFVDEAMNELRVMVMVMVMVTVMVIAAAKQCQPTFGWWLFVIFLGFSGFGRYRRSLPI